MKGTAVHDTEPIKATHTTALAAALYVANAAYSQALKMPNPAATLDDICDSLPEVLPQVLGIVKTTPELTEVLTDDITNRLWAATAVEYARIEAGPGYSYLFNFLAEKLRDGADPHTVRTTALDVPRRIRDLAVQAGA